MMGRRMGGWWSAAQVAGLTWVTPVMARLLPPAALSRCYGSARPGGDPAEKLQRAERLFRRRGWGRWTNCLSRSLIRYRYLRAMGRPAALHFGIRRFEGRWEGHAWVSVEGEPYGEAVHDLTEMLQFPGERNCVETPASAAP